MRSDRSPVRRSDGENPFVWAHRGASALAPENSLEAFLLAAELGADGIELDVRLTRDAVPVVIHDPWVWSDGKHLHSRPGATDRDRMHKVPIADCMWTDLASERLYHGKARDVAIERLEGVLEAIPRSLWVDIEVKAGRQYDSRLAAIVSACVHRRPERIIASSFDHLVLRELAEVAPSLPLLAICHARLVDPGLVLSGIPASMICIDLPFLTVEDAVRWHREGLHLGVGAIEEIEDVVMVSNWPISSIFVDDPRWLSASGVPEEGPHV